MNLFFTPDINSEIYSLPEAEAKHCIKVLRMQMGDRMHLIDGQGGFYKAEVINITKKSCEVKIVDKTMGYGKRPVYLHIAIAPTKNNDRLEWFLEKATEMGIDEITPLLCDNSERKIVKPERLEKVIVSAMKQSYKAYKPQLNPLTKFSDFISKERDGMLCIAHCEDAPKEHINILAKEQQQITILIGPEGDFSSEEISLAIDKGYHATTLSISRLRTETAGIIACGAVNLINGL